MKILMLNTGNAIKRFLKRFYKGIYIILLSILSFFLYKYPQCNKVIAFLTFLSGISIFAMYFKITSYFKLNASSKSNGECELNSKD